MEIISGYQIAGYLLPDKQEISDLFNRTGYKQENNKDLLQITLIPRLLKSQLLLGEKTTS